MSAPTVTRAAPTWPAFVLASTAGWVDCYAFFKFAVFASFMSGNTTIGGMQAGTAHWAQAALNLLPIPAFVVGAFAGTLLMHSRSRQPEAALLVSAAALLAGAIGLASFSVALDWLSVVLLTLAMGGVNTAIARIGGQSVGTGYVSGDLHSLGRHLALAVRRTALPDAINSSDTHGRRATALACVWGTFLLGALVAGAATPRLGVWTLVPPVVVLLALAPATCSPKS